MQRRSLQHDLQKLNMHLVDSLMAARDWSENGFPTGTRHLPGKKDFAAQRPSGSYYVLTAVLTVLPCRRSTRCIHRSDSSVPHHIGALCWLRSGKIVPRGIPLGALREMEHTTAGSRLLSSGSKVRSQVE